MVTRLSPIRVANPNVDRYVQDQRGAYAGLRIWDPDFALSRDPWIYESMLRDPVIRQCLGDRLRAVAGGEWSIVAARNPTEEDEEAARVIDQAVGELENTGFQMARVNLARFVWEGARHALVYGTRWAKPYGDGQVREWWYPTKLRDMSKRRVRVWREGGKIVRKIAPILDEKGVDFDFIGDPWPEDRIITAIYDDEEGRLGFGRGLGDSCYWFFFLKWKLIEEGIDAARKWAQGLIVAKTDAAALGDTTQTSTDSRDALIDAVKNSLPGGVVAMGLTDELDHFDNTGKGALAMMQWLRMADDGLRGVLTGSKLPTGGGSDQAGSLARAQGESDTSEGVYQLDSAILDESITAGLIVPIWKRNRENLVALGLGDARMPSFVSENEKHEDAEQNSRLITAALEAGMKLKKDEAYAKIGLTPPTPEDEEAGNVIEKAAELPGGFDGFGENGRDPASPAPDDSDTFIPSASAFAARCCGGHFAILDPRDFPAWVTLAIRRSARTLRGLVRMLARKHAGLGDVTQDARDTASAAIREDVVDAMAAADLEGRAEVLAEAGDLEPTGMIDVPKVPFGEAVRDVVKRNPKLAPNAAAVADLYRQGPAFALAKSMEVNVTERVQGIVSEFIGRGDAGKLTVSRIARESEDFTNAYAETVLRTNVATAQTEGAFTQTKDPNVRRVIVAFQVSVTRDSDLRRGRKQDAGENHGAADGLIAGVDDPIWISFAPPYSYNCRCKVIRKTIHQIRRLGLLNDDGSVQRRMPAGINAFRRHPNFTRSRMPGGVS